jgi:hypothetical protein
MTTLNQIAYSGTEFREIAGQNTILRGQVGSGLHGVTTGADDRDEMGVCIEPPAYVIGNARFEQYQFRTQPEGVRSGPGDLAHLDFGPACELTDRGVPCERPARWIANIHMHLADMPRVVLCDQHRAAHLALEAEIRPGWTNRCAVCRQSVNPGDFIGNEAAL